MKKFKISIVLPSINPGNWIYLFKQIQKSVGKHSFEVLAVGPFFPSKELENNSSFRFVQDFGSPSRCLMIAASLADSEYLTWLPDDCIVESLALEKTIDLFDSKTKIDGITILYSEGPNYSGTQHLDPNYWISQTHEDLRLPLVKPYWKIAPIFMYNLEYFKELGGLDCRFEHINMNTHDFTFRLQNKGGIMYSSPTRVFASNWQPWTNIESQKSPIQLAYELNDKPLFDKCFSDCLLRDKIDFENWRVSEPVWKRRFKE